MRDWLQPRHAIDLLVHAGAPPPGAWEMIADAMRRGTIRCLAKSMTTHLFGDKDDHRADSEVACDVWTLGTVPSPGHAFWSSGDVNLTIHLPGTQSFEQALQDELGVAPISPTMELRGVQLDRAGLELLIYERVQDEDALRGMGGDLRAREAAAEDTKPKRRGRPRGAGSLADADASLIIEMKELIASGKAFSPHGAAILVANRAKGGGSDENKASRLGRRYRVMENKSAG